MSFTTFGSVCWLSLSYLSLWSQPLTKQLLHYRRRDIFLQMQPELSFPGSLGLSCFPDHFPGPPAPVQLLPTNSSRATGVGSPPGLWIQGPKTQLYFCQTSVMIPPIAASPEVSFCLCLAILDQLLLLRCKLFPHAMLSSLTQETLNPS